MHTKSVTLSDGTEMFFKTAGSGRPLIFVHGWAVDSSLFKYQLEGLSDKYEVICPDLRGHGLTKVWDSSLDIDRLVGDLEEFIGALGLSDIIVVGWSMGAMLLWKCLANSERADIAGLVSVDMSPRIHNDPLWQLGLRDGRDIDTALKTGQIIKNNWDAMTQQFVPKIFTDRFVEQNQEYIDEVMEDARKLDPTALSNLWISMVQQDCRPLLSKIKVPSIVSFGIESDFYHEETSLFVRKALGDADVVGFKGAGHAPHVEAHKQFNQMIDNFSSNLGVGIVSKKNAQAI